MTDREYLESLIPRRGRRFVEGALAGDPNAAIGLLAVLGQRRAVEVCMLLFTQRRAPEACRALLQVVWGVNSRRVIAAVGRKRLDSLFSFAEFPHPPPGLIRLWRGSSGLDAGGAAAGLSWSMCYPTACWFAHYWGRTLGGAPLVVTAEVPAAQVVLLTPGYLPGSFEGASQEAVVLEPPTVAEVAGTPEEWEREAAGVDLASMLRLPEIIAELGALASPRARDRKEGRP